tara:strand:+ start:7282 stop:7830 length:549 start_codon:yes stop_codon:yes gene_type:complete
MKNHIIVLLLLLNIKLLIAQDIFDKYQKNPAVSYLSVSPKMFEMLGKLSLNSGDPKMDGFIQMVQSMEHFKVLSTKNTEIAEEMEVWLNNELSQTVLESNMNISEKEVEVKFSVVYGSDDVKVERLVMFVKGAHRLVHQEGLEVSNLDFILLSIKGSIDLNQLAFLTEIIDIPGGKFLKEIN